MVNAKAAFATALQILNDAGIDDALFDARLLFTHATNKDHRLMPQDDSLSDQQQQALFQLCHRRAAHEPLQYILGSWQFMNIELKVGKGVLIPRSDSECVCMAAIEKLKNMQEPIVYDLCAGSGALGLAIKAFVPSASVTAVELSEEALKYLEHNANKKIQAVKADVLNYHKKLKQNSIALIISNPPYIALAELPTLQPELAQEPKMALTDGLDGLSFYRHIASSYYPCVKPNGFLAFEIGHTQGSAVTQICKAAGWQNIGIQGDLEGRDRAVVAEKL